MTNSEKYIAAIEISSSKVIGAVGRTKDNIHLDVIAVEQERTLDCVRYGVIMNVEETAHTVMRILNRLEKRTGVAPRRIKAVYVGLAGLSVRNISTQISRALPEDTEITESILEAVCNDARRVNIDSSLEIVDAIPRTYFVNKTEMKSPVGTFGNSLRTMFNIIACRPILKKNIDRVVYTKVGKDIAGIVVTPLAVADMVLSADEKRLGCMLVDMGAETTTVSIYQNGSLIYLATLPMGSRNITSDITSLSVLEERAEEIKTTSGSAIAQKNPSTLNLNGVKLSDVSNLVVARSEEIVANIIEQINYANITDKQLAGGIIVVGGGFNLNRMTELLRQKSDLSVRRASLPTTITLEDTKAPTYETIEVISILNSALSPEKPACLEMVGEGEELPLYDGNYTRDGDTDQTDDRDETPEARSPKAEKQGWLSKLLKGAAEKISTGMWGGDESDGDTEIE